VVIPLCAKEISAEFQDVKDTPQRRRNFEGAHRNFDKLFGKVSSVAAMTNLNLLRLIHQKGVNYRYLGRLWELATCEPGKNTGVICKVTACDILLLEMVSRAIKEILHAQMRTKMRNLKQPLEQPYIELLIG
jgi:hypothetical protein